MEDVLGFTSLSLFWFIVVIFIVYVPAFIILRRRSVDSRHFRWIAPLLLNLPVYILFYTLIDKAFRDSEAKLFMCLFFFFGAAFGWLYHYYRKQPGTSGNNA